MNRNSGWKWGGKERMTFGAASNDLMKKSIKKWRQRNFLRFVSSFQLK